MKVLVVDDNPANRKLLVRALSSWKHEVLEADGGQAALDIYQAERPELVLMDAMMPDVDGMETARRIRALPGGDDISIIFVTAQRESEGLIPALEAGGDDYVTKPVNLNVLATKMKVHQRIRDLSRQLVEQNAQLQRHNLELQREHKLIDHFFDRIQHTNFHPAGMLDWHTSSASAFSGDVVLSAPRPGGGLYLMLGDFTGHGLSAAMGSLPAAEIFHRLATYRSPVGTMARELNNVLYNYLPVEIFCAATLLELDVTGTRVQMWAGGLPDGALLTPEGELRPLTSRHMPLGVVGEDQFDDTATTLEVSRDSRIYLMTDGITEAMAKDGKSQFGEQRVRETLAYTPADQSALDALRRAVSDFTGGNHAHDDTTVAELRCLPLVAGSA